MPFAQKASISFTSPILESLFYEFEKKKKKTNTGRDNSLKTGRLY